MEAGYSSKAVQTKNAYTAHLITKQDYTDQLLAIELGRLESARSVIRRVLRNNKLDNFAANDITHRTHNEVRYLWYNTHMMGRLAYSRTPYLASWLSAGDKSSYTMLDGSAIAIAIPFPSKCQSSTLAHSMGRCARSPTACAAICLNVAVQSSCAVLDGSEIAIAPTLPFSDVNSISCPQHGMMCSFSDCLSCNMLGRSRPEQLPFTKGLVESDLLPTLSRHQSGVNRIRVKRNIC